MREEIRQVYIASDDTEFNNANDCEVWEMNMPTGDVEECEACDGVGSIRSVSIDQCDSCQGYGVVPFED